MKQIQEYYNIQDKKFKLFLTPKQIDEIVTSLAKQISSDFKGKKPLFLIVLKGSVFFASDLLRKLTIECEMDSVVAKSYGNDMHSSGMVNLNCSNIEIKGREVIIVEDIVDSGLTLQSLLNKLKKMEPESIDTVSLLSKPSQRTVEVKVKYVGVEIPDGFVIGYGLDLAESGRQLPGIYRLEE